jgi:serine protease
MRARTIRHAALVTLAVLFAAAAPGAYALFGPKWGVQQVEYYINPANGDGIPEADVIADIQAAAMAWTTQSSANILPYYMGRTSGSTAAMNGKNEMFFRNASKDAAAATTYWWSDSNNRLIDSDIVIWDATYTFVSSGAGCSGAIFVQDVMTHEFGHALGIAHSSVSSATMYPVIQYCSNAMRSLDADDIAGIEKLYPAGAAAVNTAPVVSISAPSSGAAFVDGAPISFSGAASDNEDGDLGTTIVWLSSRDGQIGTGTAFARVLSAGSHTVTARVTDSKGMVTQAERSVVVETAVVEQPAASGITLSGRGYKVKGTQRVDLSWSGASTGSMDVYRNGIRIAITPNDGAHTDAINVKGGGSYTYKVCGAGTSICSSQIVIGF